MNTNEQLISIIEEAGISAYQDASVLGLFAGEDIGDIGVEQWFHKNFNDIPDAALTRAGFNPQEAKLEAELFSNTVLTAAEKMVISEKDWAQFQRFGMDTNGVEMLAAKVGILASNYLFQGADMDGDTPVTQYNFITDLGATGIIDDASAGDGTLARPSIMQAATNGGWSTFSNKSHDLSILEAQLVSKGYNLASTIVFYPQVAHKPMTMRGSAAMEISAKQYLEDDGVMAVLPIPDKYLTTIAGPAPTADLFDLYAVDMSQIKIGYTRTERTRVIAPFGDVRTNSVESEVWFTPYLIPRPIKIGGTANIVKGVSRVTAIAP